MNKKLLILISLCHFLPVQADPARTLDTYKVAGLAATAVASGLGIGLAQWLRSDLDQQHAKAKTDLPQTPEQLAMELSTKRKEQRKLLQQQTAFSTIFRLNAMVYHRHANEQQPSKARRARACKKIKQLAPGCPEAAMVVNKLENHSAECAHDCESPENWNALRNSRYPCYRIRGPHADLQHVIANENLIIGRQLSQLQSDMRALNAQRARYQRVAIIETKRAMAQAASVSLGALALASLGALGMYKA